MKKSISLSALGCRSHCRRHALGCPMPTGRQGNRWQRHAFTALLCAMLLLPSLSALADPSSGGWEGPGMGCYAQNYQWAKNITGTV